MYPARRQFLAQQARTIMSDTVPTIARRFAPLKPNVIAGGEGVNGVVAKEKLMTLRGVVFDVDGTMCLPQNYMFGAMRAALGIPKSIDILNHIYSLPTTNGEQEAAMDKVKAIEREAMSQQQPQPGLVELMTYLDSRGIPKAICTRNFTGPVDHLLTKFLPGSKFAPIVTREFRPPKPDPAGILHIASELGIEKEENPTETLTEGETDGEVGKSKKVLPMIMVGDSVDDMLAGRRAGAATVLLVNADNKDLADHECTDLVVSRLDELTTILDDGFVARFGKGK